MVCGYDGCARNLVFHHLHSKRFDLSARSFQLSWKRLMPELKKCIMVCHNCHGEIHAGFDHDVDSLNKSAVALLEAWRPG